MKNSRDYSALSTFYQCRHIHDVLNIEWERGALGLNPLLKVESRLRFIALVCILDDFTIRLLSRFRQLKKDNLPSFVDSKTASIDST